MRILCLLAVLVLAPPVQANGLEPADATEALRGRLRAEWQSLVDARHHGAWTLAYRGVRHTGDRVVALGGWTYFLAGERARCRIQGAEYLTCGTGDAEDLRGRRTPVWSAAPAAPSTVASLRRAHRALWGKTLAIEIDPQGVGRATIETVVSTPAAATRTSRRYRAVVTVTAQGFAVGAPQLVEEYEETCHGVNGCHATHWTCTRAR